MVDNQHKQISGYRDFTQFDIDVINHIKAAETELGKLWREIGATDAVDRRWLAVARTHFEEGFMAFVRAVAKPESRF